MAPSLGPSLVNVGGYSTWAPDRSKAHRKRLVRGKTLSIKRLSLRARKAAAEETPDVDVERPRTRADCASVPRPCPFVSCKYHLYLDVLHRTGNLKLNFPDIEPDEMKDSCVLDIADEGGATMDRVGEAMNLGRARVDQIEGIVSRKLRRLPVFVRAGE